MQYITIIEAQKKWGISQSKIRKLIKENRIEGVVKIGNTWNIPANASEPIDQRTIKNKFIMNYDIELLKEVDYLNLILNQERPFPKNTLQSLKDSLNLEFIYNSNAIEGNTLTLRETQIALEGITIGGKTIREHLEAINQEHAIHFLEELIKDKQGITEWNIKNIHAIILKDIDHENAGKYRTENVVIKGAEYISPDYIILQELMEKFFLNIKKWEKFHPIVKASLIHGELVKIHPFIDGNGRTSRLITNLSLMQDGYLPIIVKKENRLEYYEALDKAHTKGDYSNFINLILKLEKEVLDKYIQLLKIKVI